MEFKTAEIKDKKT